MICPQHVAGGWAFANQRIGSESLAAAIEPKAIAWVGRKKRKCWTVCEFSLCSRWSKIVAPRSGCRLRSRAWICAASTIAGAGDQVQVEPMNLGARSGRRLSGPWIGLILGCSAAAAQQPTPLPFILKQVGPGVYAAIDGPAHEAGANAGFIVGDDGVLVVDSFFYPDATRALVAQIHRLTPKPIRYVVNTHYHVDHTGGDGVLKAAGAIIIAHRNVRGWLRTYNLNLIGDRITPETKSQIETLPLPDVVTDNELAIWLGARKVMVRTVLGHTGGDVSVYIPDANILFTGDLFWRKLPPNLIDGSVSEWAATDSEFAHMAQASRTVFVPGHGDLGNAGDVEDFRSYLLDLRRLVREGRAAGLHGDKLVRIRGSQIACSAQGLADQRPRGIARNRLHGPGAGGNETSTGSGKGLTQVGVAIAQSQVGLIGHDPPSSEAKSGAPPRPSGRAFAAHSRPELLQEHQPGSVAPVFVDLAKVTSAHEIDCLQRLRRTEPPLSFVKVISEP